MDSNDSSLIELQSDFWQCSGLFYQHEKVKTLLLFLQDRFDLSINRLLFVLWHSSKFERPITLAQIQRCEAALVLAEDKVIALRRERRALKERMLPKNQNSLNSYDKMLGNELILEKKIQAILVSSIDLSEQLIMLKKDYPAIKKLILESFDRVLNKSSIEQKKSLEQLTEFWFESLD